MVIHRCLAFAQGQTLTLQAGGTLSNRFTAVNATLNVDGGNAPSGVEVAGALLNISGGTLSDIDAFAGATVSITGGSVNGVSSIYSAGNLHVTGGSLNGVQVFGGGVATFDGGSTTLASLSSNASLSINAGIHDFVELTEGGSAQLSVSGGTVGGIEVNDGGSVSITGGTLDSILGRDGGMVTVSGGVITGDHPLFPFPVPFLLDPGSSIHILATSFMLSGQPIDGLANVGDSIVLGERGNQVLSGLYADGSSFSYILNAFWSTGAELRLTVSSSGVTSADFR